MFPQILKGKGENGKINKIADSLKCNIYIFKSI